MQLLCSINAARTRFSHTRFTPIALHCHGQGAGKSGNLVGSKGLFFNNFFQPGSPTGFFHFTQGVTEQVIGRRRSRTGEFVREPTAGIWRSGFESGLVRSCGQQVKGDSFLFPGRLESDAEAHIEFGYSLRMEHALFGAEQPGPVQRFYWRYRHCGADQRSQIPTTGTTLISHSGNLTGYHGLSDFRTS